MKKILLSLTLIVSNLPLLAEQTEKSSSRKDPYVKTKEVGSSKNSSIEEPLNISLCYEAFSLPLRQAAKLRREGHTDTALYAKLVAEVETGGVKQEIFSIVRAKSGDHCTNASIEECMYPTEWEPAELPNSVGVARAPALGDDAPTPTPDPTQLESAPDLGELPILMSPATGSAFDTKNVGLTLEFEANIGSDSRWIDLRLAPLNVYQTGRSSWGQGVSTLETPKFEVQRMSTGVTLRTNQPLLIGTMNRPPVSKVDPDSANRVWFTFVTASMVKY